MDFIQIPTQWLLQSLVVGVYSIIVYKMTVYAIEKEKTFEFIKDWLYNGWRLRIVTIPLLFIYITVLVVATACFVSLFLVGGFEFVKTLSLTICISLPMVWIKFLSIWVTVSDQKSKEKY